MTCGGSSLEWLPHKSEDPNLAPQFLPPRNIELVPASLRLPSALQLTFTQPSVYLPTQSLYLPSCLSAHPRPVDSQNPRRSCHIGFGVEQRHVFCHMASALVGKYSGPHRSGNSASRDATGYTISTTQA